MFDVPELSVDSIHQIADWVELCALFSPSGVMSQTDVADVFQDAGLIGGAASDFFPGDISYLDSDTFSEDDAGERFTEDVWADLTSRSGILGDAYPFDVRKDTINRRADNWLNTPAFAMLLIADIGRAYSSAGIVIEANSKSGRLCEKVVEASKRGLFRGTSVRFGWPREPNWPTGINERIQRLGDALGLAVENLEGKTRPTDKDRGLDVAARLSFGDNGPATLIFLTQCATGKHWKEKRGEPSIAEWRDILRWEAHLVRVIAVPWRLDDTFDYARARRHFDDVVVLDRPRLLAGNPDRFLEPSVQDEIRNWCKSKAKKLPRLGQGYT